MSVPAMHTAVGISVPFAAGAIAYLRARRVTAKALLVLALAMLFCGIWAEIPDIPKLIAGTWSPHDPKYVNYFFFHGFLDTHQSEDRGLLEGFSVIMVIFFSIFFACSKTVLDNQRTIDALKVGKLPKAVPPVAPQRIQYKDIVDIHCHVLPGVDDGPEAIEESLAMCRRLVEVGVSHTVATPHLPWRGAYDVDRITAAYDRLKARLAAEKIPLELSLGADIRITWDLIERLKGSSVLTIAKSRYFLLELDNLTVPEHLEEFIGRCVAEGYHPILTHPERNAVLQSDIARLKEMAKLPMLIQLSAHSLVGLGGARDQKMAIELLRAGLVNIIASDAHAVNMRLEEFIDGLAVAESIVGREKVRQMVTTVPGLIVRNTPWP